MANNSSKATKKTTQAPRTARGADPSDDDHDDGDDRPLSPRKRRRLLARVAGNVASGIVQAPSESSGSADAIAEISVDIAEAILQKTGL